MKTSSPYPPRTTRALHAWSEGRRLSYECRLPIGMAAQREPEVEVVMRYRMLAVVVTLSALIAGTGAAQQPADSARRRPMMQSAEMRAMTDSADARFERLVATMNAAKGDRKVQAMADVINELMTERRRMREHMRQQMMQNGMRQGGPGTPGMMHPPGAMPPAAGPRPPKPDSTKR